MCLFLSVYELVLHVNNVPAFATFKNKSRPSKKLLKSIILNESVFSFVMMECPFRDGLKGRAELSNRYSSSLIKMTCSRSIHDTKNQFDLLLLSSTGFPTTSYYLMANTVKYSPLVVRGLAKM